MNIIYLGLMFEKESLEEAGVKSKSVLQMATHNFQKSLCDGLYKQENIDFHILNIPPIGSFPFNYKKITVKNITWGDNNCRIGYINLPYIKKKIQEKKLFHKIENYLMEKENYILIYSLYMPFVSAATKIKAKHKNVKICLIQTDDVAGRNGLDKYDTFFKVREANRMVNKSLQFDSFIILTKYLMDPLEIGNRPWMIMEGICDEKQKESSITPNKKNICLYTGTLNDEYGIREIVDAFMEMKDCVLWLCGLGDAVEYIKQMEKSCDNIKYLGYKKRDEIEKLRDECDFLINPRVPTGTYTLYSFPSKTMEYMMSGKPTIMYKLEGIPDEYDDFLIYLENNSLSNIDEMKRQLEIIFASDYNMYLERAKRGRLFLIRNKSAIKQATRIVHFLKATYCEK